MIEWFRAHWDAFVQSMVWESFFGNFHWVDWFTLIFLVAGILYGLKNGVMAEIAEILEIMLVVILVNANFEHFSAFLKTHMTYFPKEYFRPASFIILGIVIWTIIGLIIRYLKRFVHTQTAPLLRNGGGMILGALHLLIIFSFISQAIILFNIPATNKVYTKGGSVSGHFISQLAPDIYGMVLRPDEVLNPVNE